MIIYKYLIFSYNLNHIQGNLAVKIKLLKPPTLFSDFFNEITNKYININIQVVSKWQLNFYQLNNQNKAKSN